MSAAKIKRRRNRLYRAQHGLCHWCSIPMIHWDDVPDKTGRLPRTMATLDHLRDRFDPDRKAPNYNHEQRWVIACWDCNNKRAKAAEAAQPINALHDRSGRHPSRRRTRPQAAWSELND